MEAIAECESVKGHVNRQILVSLLKDTEEDQVYWCEKQLSLMEKMRSEYYIQAKTT